MTNNSEEENQWIILASQLDFQNCYKIKTLCTVNMEKPSAPNHFNIIHNLHSVDVKGSDWTMNNLKHVAKKIYIYSKTKISQKRAKTEDISLFCHEKRD